MSLLVADGLGNKQHGLLSSAIKPSICVCQLKCYFPRVPNSSGLATPATRFWSKRNVSCCLHYKNIVLTPSLRSQTTDSPKGIVSLVPSGSITSTGDPSGGSDIGALVPSPTQNSKHTAHEV